MIEKFYKIARPDGWDFFSGKSINYRANIGKTVRRLKMGNVKLCSETAIHASRDPNQCFIGGSIPCSVFLVSGKPYGEDSYKCGFRQLKILEELNPESVFQWRYREACKPIHPLKIIPPKKITEEHLKILSQWASVRDSVWASVWASVRASVGDSVWAYIGFIFAPSVKKWRCAKHEKSVYPFQPAVDLWMIGLIPSFDGKTWRLHGYEDAKVLWEGKR